MSGPIWDLRSRSAAHAREVATSLWRRLRRGHTSARPRDLTAALWREQPEAAAPWRSLDRPRAGHVTSARGRSGRGDRRLDATAATAWFPRCRSSRVGRHALCQILNSDVRAVESRTARARLLLLRRARIDTRRATTRIAPAGGATPSPARRLMALDGARLGRRRWPPRLWEVFYLLSSVACSSAR